MGIINDIIRKFIPNRGVRSAVRRGGRVASKTAAHEAYGYERDELKAEALRKGDRTTTAVFERLPESRRELLESPYNNLMTPMGAAALYVAALNAYAVSRDEAIAMIGYLRGPNPLAPNELSALDERMSQGDAGCLARSYLAGATPQNGYEPSRPYTVVMNDNFYEYHERDEATVHVACGGSEGPRPVSLRKAGGDLWYLGGLSLLDGVWPSR